MAIGDLYVAGVGASAGGLTAILNFFSQISKGTGIAYVVLTHIKRDYHSRLNEMIAKNVELPVVRVDRDVTMEPDHIYVLTENLFVTVKGDKLLVRKRQESEIVNRAVDIFFESVAEEYGSRSIGIVLSGAGEDGLSGVKKIEARGGLVMVQSPEQAIVQGMPEAIIDRDDPAIIADTESLARQLTVWALNRTLGSN